MSDIAWLLGPLVAGVLVLLTHVRLGEQVLQRGIVFIDLAIAQTAALGVMLAESLHWHGFSAWLATAGFAIAGAMLVAWLSHRFPERREALIGLLYVTGASLAVVWVSADPHGASRLSALLAGDVLWTTWPSLLPLAAATAGFLLVAATRDSQWLAGRLFYPLFALMVSLSLPLLGLYLVFTCLIVPALMVPVLGRQGRSRAIVCASVAWTSGLTISYFADWPTGPTIVLALVFMLGLVMSYQAVSRGDRTSTLGEPS